MPLCKLCKRQVNELKLSHIIPKSGYKNLRDSRSENPNPVIIGKDNKPYQTSKQLMEYMLCAECEDKFNKNGEKYIAELTSSNNKEYIYNLFDIESTDKIIHIKDEIDVDKIIYFALSVFWRGSVAKNKELSNYTLGERYEEEFRIYLKDKKVYPSNTFITLFLIKKTKNGKEYFRKIISYPVLQRAKEGYFMHGFLYNGLLFMMALGGMCPPELKKISLYYSKIIGIADINSFNFLKNMVGFILGNGRI